MIDDNLVRAHRARGLSPEHPFIRGTAQNPDTFFQAREAVNPYHERVPEIVEGAMKRFAARTGRQYRLFEYEGAADADRVLILMGSGVETARAAAAALRAAGEKVGVLQVRLFRPFSVAHLLAALPEQVRRIAVLDRTKEPGGAGEPLFQDIVTSLAGAVARGERATMPHVIGGRYGLSSKEFTPAMAKAAFDELKAAKPRTNFTLGIDDDVSHTSLAIDESFQIEKDIVTRAVFYGLGADGTVGANKNSVKIIAEDAGLYAQGYFVYDSHKSGAQTISHLRFGPEPIEAPYLIAQAGFVACHQFVALQRQDLLRVAAPGATVLLNAPYSAAEIWDRLPRPVQQTFIDKKLRLFVIDASAVAREVGLGSRTNTILQTCFFAISGVLPREKAIGYIKESIRKTYARKGQSVVDKNFAAVDGTLARLSEAPVPANVTSQIAMPALAPANAPDFVRTVTARIFAGLGDRDSGQRHTGRRHVPVGHRRVRKAQPLRRRSGLARRPLRSMRTMQLRLSAQRHSGEILSRGSPGRGAGRVQVGAGQRPRLSGGPLHAAVLCRRLHGLRTLRRGVPRDQSARGGRESHQHGGQGAAADGGARRHRLLRNAAGQRSRQGGFRRRPRRAIPAAAVRVSRRLRRLRRDAVSQIAEPAVRRSRADRQRHRLLLHLRRQPSRYALDERRRGARAGVVEFAVRGQCRVRTWLPARGRQTSCAGFIAVGGSRG